MNDCINTTATTANPHSKEPYEMYFEELPPANTLAFMEPGFRRVHRSHKSEPKAERCFYLNRGWNHSRDYVKVVTLSGQSSNTRDVTWEVDRVPIIAATPDAGEAAGQEPWGPDDNIRYLPPEPPGPPGPPGTSVPPGPLEPPGPS